MKIFGVHFYTGSHPDKKLTDDEKNQASEIQNSKQGPRTVFPGIHVGNKSFKKALEKEVKNKNTQRNQSPEALLPPPASATPATLLFGKSSRQFLEDHGVEPPPPRKWEDIQFSEVPPEVKELEEIEKDAGKSS